MLSRRNRYPIAIGYRTTNGKSFPFDVNSELPPSLAILTSNRKREDAFRIVRYSRSTRWEVNCPGTPLSPPFFHLFPFVSRPSSFSAKQRVSSWMDGLLFRRLVSQALTDFVLQITRSLETAYRRRSVADRGKRELYYKSRTRYKSSPVQNAHPDSHSGEAKRQFLLLDNDVAGFLKLIRFLLWNMNLTRSFSSTKLNNLSAMILQSNIWNNVRDFRHKYLHSLFPKTSYQCQNIA